VEKAAEMTFVRKTCEFKVDEIDGSSDKNVGAELAVSYSTAEKKQLVC